MNLKKTYQQNKKNKTAIGQFNVYNYEMVKGIVEAGKEKDTSVLIGVSPSAIELIGI
ncbi:MAG: class II fructose-bisphosphate aldolase, partial [Minisyncoccales bacterium]